MNRPRLIVHQRRSVWPEFPDGSDDGPQKRRLARARFTLRGLLLLTAFVGALMAVLVEYANRAHEQKRAVAALRKVGARIEYSDPPDWPFVGFVQRKFGIDFVANATFVSLIYRPVSPREVKLLSDLRHLKGLDLFRAQIDDEGLAQLANLRKLVFLDLRHTQITDKGLRHLRGLHRLDRLYLASCKIDGPGLVYLQSLSRLLTLDLAFTSIQDSHLAPLRQLERLVDLNLNRTAITEEALHHLRTLRNLRQLTLYGVEIKPQKLLEFSRSRPRCNVSTDANLATTVPPS